MFAPVVDVQVGYDVESPSANGCYGGDCVTYGPKNLAGERSFQNLRLRFLSHGYCLDT